MKDKEILKKGKKNDQTKTLKTVKNKGRVFISHTKIKGILENKRNIEKIKILTKIKEILKNKRNIQKMKEISKNKRNIAKIKEILQK